AGMMLDARFVRYFTYRGLTQNIAFACPSTSSGRTAAWYFPSFVGSFFARRAKKEPTKDKKTVACVSPTIKQSASRHSNLQSAICNLQFSSPQHAVRKAQQHLLVLDGQIGLGERAEVASLEPVY